MRILLTGATGFLGSSLAHAWASHGHELWLLTRPTSSKKRIAGLLDTVNIVSAVTAEEISAVVCTVSPEVIVHTACAYGRNGENSIDLLSANVTLGAVLLQALLDSASQHTQPVTFMNTGTVLAPDVSLYALSKNQFSAWGRALAMQASDKLRFIDIQLQQMYGYGDDRSKFTTNVIEACRNNDSHIALTAGEQRRDFIHITDVVSAFNSILEHRHSFAASDHIEVGSGEAVTMRSFVELAKLLACASTTLNFGAVPYRANEAMLSVADTTRLRALGWQPSMKLADGLRTVLSEKLSLSKE